MVSYYKSYPEAVDAMISKAQEYKTRQFEEILRAIEEEKLVAEGE